MREGGKSKNTRARRGKKNRHKKKRVDLEEVEGAVRRMHCEWAFSQINEATEFLREREREIGCREEDKNSQTEEEGRRMKGEEEKW